MKFSDWYYSSQQPQLPGVYERLVPSGTYSYWDGKRWYGYANTPKMANDNYIYFGPSRMQYVMWRGLAKPAK